MSCTVSHTRNGVANTIREAGSASLGIYNLNERIAIADEEANAARGLHSVDVGHRVAGTTIVVK